MSESIHGHEVLELIGSHPEPWPLSEFAAQAGAAFGPDPRFHNCHNQGFTLEQLLAFFASKGKITLGTATIALGPVGACQH